ncbi:type 1 glutamine amidotransferase domain-containing protein [Pseudomonas gingeri]|uniref:type 1 glutamine amidotransferase domain-containing protein n=1 Tax=Pseudomonas gingeri TaxID=117681 RepID=UPI00159FC47A|nr:type 1 glutamine amidotransferase domain-containing protein [Pseudomonas gingeri]NWA25584.1 type 1 glutamine amidotransferase domain-containing protein [Pseudomonas gingeri]NWD68936.1 type 1 glutamine amidotransferase domain-containing protein [Pseudomonas gingeri]
MNISKRILMVLTSQATMGDTERPTGVWFEELTTPYYSFIDAGFEVLLASPKGGQIPLDPHSREEKVPSVERFLNDPKAMMLLQVSQTLNDVADMNFAAVFLPGGHGTMWDLPANTELAALLSKTWRDGKVVAAVCHGPAGLLSAVDEQGRPLVSGRKISAFSNEEEEAAGLTAAMPFLLEDRVRELGGLYEGVPKFEPFAIRDGRLVTGQNPMSSEKTAQLTVEAINSQVLSIA